jgi:hypothetical protein
MRLDFKCWYQSRAIWGALIAIAAGIAGMYGYHITPQDQQTLIELLSALTSAAGGLIALVGRILATHQIGAPPKELLK